MAGHPGEDISNNEVELFSYINFFHLIGTFRFYCSGNIEIIENELYSILKNEKVHQLIKYSAIQILTLTSYGCNDSLNNYKNMDLVTSEYKNIFSDIENNGILAKYIPFYSVYYYRGDIKYNKILQNHLNKIVVDGKIDKEKFFTFLPQIIAFMVNLNTEKYHEHKQMVKIEDFFDMNVIEFLELKKYILKEYL